MCAEAETGSRASGTVRVMESFRTDVDCLARSVEEPRAFEPIFERHFVAVHTYLHRRAGRDLADELAAETFALAFEHRSSCRGAGSALPWLYGIATNLLRRRWRAERRQLRAYGRSGVDRVGATAVGGSRHPVDGVLGAVVARRPVTGPAESSTATSGAWA